MFESYKEVGRAVGAKKPQEAQKAKALWAMNAAKDGGGFFMSGWSEGCNTLWPDGFRSDPRFVGQAFVGRGPVAFSGCMGQCVYAQLLRSGTSQGGTGRMASSSSSL